MRLRFLEPTEVRFWMPSGAASPRCEIAFDRCLLDTKLRKCFPLSHPDEYLSISDGTGTEVAIIKHVKMLDPESRTVVQTELDKTYFTPAIEKIVSLKQEASMWMWEVATQRGHAVFYLRGVRDSVHEVAPGRWHIYSIDGQRYEIQNYESLDARSQNLFETLF